MNRYVITSHSEAEHRAAADLVAQHQPGRGVRAAIPFTDAVGQLTHLYALQGETREELDALHAQVVAPNSSTTATSSSTLSFDMCTDLAPCALINDTFGHGPAGMPEVDFWLFLHVEFTEPPQDTLVLPEVRSLMAGASLDRGRAALVQLASNDRAEVQLDAGAWALHPQVTTVRAFLASGRNMVRSPHP